MSATAIPYVLQKAREQLETLQHTTTIYLHPDHRRVRPGAGRTMPGELKVVYFVNSGSEANDLALLMARLYTGNYDVIALRNGYHGGSPSAMGLTAHSTWKYNLPHSFGIHHAIAPYPYRGPWGMGRPGCRTQIRRRCQERHPVTRPRQGGGLLRRVDSGRGRERGLPGRLPEPSAYTHVREAGGLCIADEVQTGFGRTGSISGAFETQGVIPDIVTMAKGIGNGAPLAAVVTTPAIAQPLAERIHFNTFGGNPVSCAMGKAVLEVIERKPAATVPGDWRLPAGRASGTLQSKHAVIGDVRGKGLMTGMELVEDRDSKAPATRACLRVFERARESGAPNRQGRLFRQRPSDQAAHVHHPGRCRFHAGGTGHRTFGVVSRRHRGRRPRHPGRCAGDHAQLSRTP